MRMEKTLIVLVFSCAVIFAVRLRKSQSHSFKIKGVECEIGPNICKNVECFIVPRNRTRTQVTIICQLEEPINDVAITVIIESKNSKNIYSTWMNETVNYCENVGKGRLDLFGLAEQLLRKVDESMLQRCPIKGNYGTNNSFIDVSLLENFPVWAAPTSNLRITVRTSILKTMELIILARAVVEAKVVGA